VLILSIGMPRAGSGWHYNLIHDLNVAAGRQDARVIRQKYHLEKILTEVNCNIGALTAKRLLPVMAPALLGNTFVVKAHAGPTSIARLLIRGGLVRTTYIYRDPRDALLSAYEHGQRSRQKGQQNAFARLLTFEDALDFMQLYLDVWSAWINTPRVACYRYEDLLENYDRQAVELAVFLHVDHRLPRIQAVFDQYRPKQAQNSEQRGLHFRKGKIGRFRQVFTEEQQKTCNQAFAPFLTQMDYSLDLE
jgi:hypothetical protein